MTKTLKRELARVAIAAAAFLLALLLPLEGWPRAAAYLAVYAFIGWDILWRAVRNILRGQVFDENFLMAVATVGAIALGDYREGVAVMLFYQVGEWFQRYAVGRSRKSIASLMDIRPETANLLDESGQSREVDPEEVPAGSHILVKPGERVPLDGTVLEGTSMLDTSALTGESMPRKAEAGAEVISGCINLSGTLTVRVDKPYGESTVARILDLVENSSARKAQTENFITRFARIYTPAVCFAALALALVPPLVTGQPFGEWVYRALTFLVISCPCALVISVPLSFFGGIGGASRQGVLVKGGNYLEAIAKADTVVFDKTGTLTRGSFAVSEVAPENGFTRDTLLEAAAAAEQHSSHPIASSIRAAWGHPVDPARLGEVQEVAGQGVRALLDGREVLAGNARLMASKGIKLPEGGSGTVVHVAVEGAYAGKLVVEDSPRPDAAGAIAALRSLGVRRTVMLTGDSEAVGQRVAGSLGIDKAYTQLLPQDKVSRLEALKEEAPEGRTVLYAGDGVNDAPVLARADVGIAMGGLGSDAAIEAADVVIMTDEPSKIPTVVRIGRKTMRIVHQNIVFALGIKALVLVLGALGFATMWAAVFADVGVSVLAILNAMRALRAPGAAAASQSPPEAPQATPKAA